MAAIATREATICCRSRACGCDFTRQGFFRFDRFDGFEPWAGQRFDRGNWRVQGEMQLFRWLSFDAQHQFGKAVYYDPEQPFQGRTADANVGLTLQPSGRLSQALSYRRVAFDRESTGERVYDLDILYSRTTYQFSRQFFIRGIAQFDSSRYRVLTDFLASYELRPGTVVYAGYGSLVERRDFVNGEWIVGPRAATRPASGGCSSRRRTCTGFRGSGLGGSGFGVR